ncbi:MAG: beta-mannanase, partial [Clostridia bacterium]|nr:beta-mannanase [Clostridia bacterium]
MKYMIGVNYWGSKHGIDMWKYWDEESIRADLRELQKYGVKWMRVFPNWRDFQPIHTLYGHANKLVEYRFADDRPIDNEYGLDMEQIARFRTFCDIAAECGMKFCVGIVTGWMSGRMFAPPAVEGKNHITDPESLKWQNRFVRGFVHYLK